MGQGKALCNFGHSDALLWFCTRIVCAFDLLRYSDGRVQIVWRMRRGLALVAITCCPWTCLVLSKIVIYSRPNTRSLRLWIQISANSFVIIFPHSVGGRPYILLPNSYFPVVGPFASSMPSTCNLRTCIGHCWDSHAGQSSHRSHLSPAGFITI